MGRGRTESPLLTPGEVCDLLRISPSTFRAWCADGLLRTVPTAGGHNRVPATDPRVRAALRAVGSLR